MNKKQQLLFGSVGALLITLLTACGQKGPLTLPQAPAPAASAPAK